MRFYGHNYLTIVKDVLDKFKFPLTQVSYGDMCIEFYFEYKSDIVFNFMVPFDRRLRSEINIRNHLKTNNVNYDICYSISNVTKTVRKVLTNSI